MEGHGGGGGGDDGDGGGDGEEKESDEMWEEEIINKDPTYTDTCWEKTKRGRLMNSRAIGINLEDIIW